MKRYFRAFSLLLMAGSTALLSAGGPCKTTPVKVTISQSGIYPDNSGPYVDGQNGVSAFINTTCTNDLILDVTNSTRHVGFDFQNAVATNVNTPSWVPASLLPAGSRFVIGNLMYNYNASLAYQFTTIANFSFVPPGAKSNQSDQICFANPAANVYRVCGDSVPSQTALLTVTHTPATSTTPETWTIATDTSIPQIGELLVPVHNSLVNGGEFTIPFQFTVTRK
jgi:hypothetical protein